MSTNDELLHDIHAGIGELRGEIRALREHTGDRLDRHEHVVFGNGSPGLVARLVGVEKSVRRLSTSRKTTLSGATISIIGAIVTAVCAALGITTR